MNWASSQLHDNESLEQMVDTAIKRTIPSKALSRFADIISLCIQVWLQLNQLQHLYEKYDVGSLTSFTLSFEIKSSVPIISNTKPSTTPIAYKIIFQELHRFFLL